MSKTTPTLYNLTKVFFIDDLLLRTLYKMLGIEKELKFVDFRDLRSGFGWYFLNLSERIRLYMLETGRSVCNKKFKNFREDVTRLSPELISEIWQAASRFIADEIENKLKEGRFQIPELENLIKRLPTNDNEEYRKVRQKELLRNLGRVNDVSALLSNFRNEMLDYLKREFDLYKEFDSELAAKRKADVKLK